MKTIVALVDLSDLTFKVLKQAHSLAAAFQSRVIILHVVPKEPVVVDMGLIAPTIMKAPSAEVAEEHRARLLEVRDSLIKFGVDAEIRQLEGASVPDVLAETEKCQADLIILGSHHHSALYRLLVGSIADDILKHARCPVLVVPGNEAVANK